MEESSFKRARERQPGPMKRGEMNLAHVDQIVSHTRKSLDDDLAFASGQTISGKQTLRQLVRSFRVGEGYSLA